jgi:CRP/FNR family cyclic AMP-dependent transcriptional regulator
MIGKDKAKYLSKLKKSKIFKLLSEEALEEILKAAQILKYQKDELVISEGETSPYLFTVLEGSVSVSVKRQEGNDVIIGVIDEGDVFGEAAIFLKVKRTASVVSVGPSTLLRINRQDFFSFIKKKPSEGIKILMVMIYSMLHKLRDANQELAFERKTVLEQEDVDALVESIMKPE